MRRYKSTTYGQKGGEGPNTGKTAVKFTCPHPIRDQDAKPKRVYSPGAETWKNPTAFWYQGQDKSWHLNTVVDGDNLPDWHQPYTKLPATRA